MARYSIHEVLEQAIRTEQLGFEFYNDMARQFKKNTELSKIFTFLAQQEVQHEKTFNELKTRRTLDEEFENWEEVSNYLRAVVESEFFLGKSKSLPSMKNITSVIEALNFAIAFERETILYFLGLKEAVKEKQIIEKIINEEKGHITLLGRYRSSLSSI